MARAFERHRSVSRSSGRQDPLTDTLTWSIPAANPSVDLRRFRDAGSAIRGGSRLVASMPWQLPKVSMPMAGALAHLPELTVAVLVAAPLLASSAWAPCDG
jgi:hypothetical protein